MNNLFHQIIDFFGKGTPMSPAASWFLIGLLMLSTVVLVMAVRELDIFTQLAIYNVKEAGLKGVWFAACGKEACRIRKERVMDVSRMLVPYADSDKKDVWFIAHTSDGEYSADYYVIPTEISHDSPEYREAEKLAGDDENLKRALLPDSRVESYFELRDKKTGARACFFAIYMKYKNENEVEETLNAYFEEEYRREKRYALKNNKKIA